ncbi:MAG: galactokinase [Bdellovibrionales bacterium]
MNLCIKSPTRVDLAGGTLDLWPIYTIVRPAMTINCSIDIYTQVEVDTSHKSGVFVQVSDLKYEKNFSNYTEFMSCTDSPVELIQCVAKEFGDIGTYRIKTSSQSPVGGGLGGSSSLMISMIKAYSQMTGKTLSLNEQVLLAQNMEARILNKPTGCQDYFPAANVGMNKISLTDLGPKTEFLDFDESFFNSHFFLVDTGKAHNSGINNWDVYKAVIEGHRGVLKALHQVKDVTLRLNEVLLKKKYNELPEIFNHEFEARVQLADCFSSPEIEQLREIALGSGGLAVKICGAGGGGCVLVMAPPEKKQKVMIECQQHQFHPIEIKFLKH